MLKLTRFDYFSSRRKLVYKAVMSSIPVTNPPQLTSVVLLTTHGWSRLQLESITQYVFETLNVPAFSVLSTSLCASFAYAVQSAVIIDIGHEKTEITPIVEFEPVSLSAKIIPYGSQTINKALKKMLPDLTDTQIEALKRSDIYQVLSEEAAKTSWFGVNESTFPKPTDTDSIEEEGVLDVAAIVTSGRTREILKKREKEKERADAKGKDQNEEEKGNEDREFNSFYTPDLPIDSPKQPISVGRERFHGTEELVEKIVIATGEILKHMAQTTKRQDCWDNVIIIGNGSAVKGLKEAIYFDLQERFLITRPTTGSEIPSMYPSGYNTPSGGLPGTPLSHANSVTPMPTSQAQGHGQVPTQIRAAKMPEYFPEWKNYGWQEASFLGAEIAAKQIFSGVMEGTFVSRSDYNAIGPSAIWDL